MAEVPDRRWDLDALRGLMLVLMTLTHLPTRASIPTGQPFGFVSAAEGFVMVSGFMAGMVYSARARRYGDDAMQQAFYKRALKIYACQAALLCFAFTVIAAIGVIGHEDAVTGLLAFYLDRPFTALLSSLLLIYNPALLDILPIYIVFMLVSPLILVHGMHQGWGAIMTLSVLLWLGAQFGLGHAMYEFIGQRIGIPVRYEDTGAFDIFAWQFLWVLGLWLGATPAAGAAAHVAFPRWLVGTAIAIGAVALVWRHAIGQTAFPGHPTLNLLFDKWQIGPLRLINFFALLILSMRFGPWLLRHLPRLHPLETLGQASLPVFCAHLVIALTALAVYGTAEPSRSWSIDALILIGGFAALYAVAVASGAIDRRTAQALARVKARRSARADLSGATKSHASTAHSPLR